MKNNQTKMAEYKSELRQIRAELVSFEENLNHGLKRLKEGKFTDQPRLENYIKAVATYICTMQIRKANVSGVYEEFRTKL